MFCITKAALSPFKRSCHQVDILFNVIFFNLFMATSFMAPFNLAARYPGIWVLGFVHLMPVVVLAAYPAQYPAWCPH